MIVNHTGPETVNGPSVGRIFLSLAFEAGMGVPELGLELQFPSIHILKQLLRGINVIVIVIRTTNPPKVSVQQVSTFSGTAPLEQDKTGSAMGSQLQYSKNKLLANWIRGNIPNTQV